MSKKFVPTADHRGNVEAMTGFGIPKEEICRLIKNPETGKPIDKKTLELHFREEIETGQIKANATVGRFIYATITAGPGGSKYHVERVRTAAAAGLGLWLCPPYTVSDLLVSGALVPLLPDYGRPEMEIVALYPHRRQLSTKVRLFLDMLVERFAEEQRWLDATPDR
jgi:hypothetical protein